MSEPQNKSHECEQGEHNRLGNTSDQASRQPQRMLILKKAVI